MRNTLLWTGIVAATLATCGCGRERTAEISYYPDFVRLVESGRVHQVEIVQEASGVTYIKGEASAGGAAGTPEEFKDT